jgi:chaperonin cofactor prefoldin
LGTLRTNLENAWNDFSTENSSGLQAFNDQKERYNGNIGRLEKLETRLTNQLEELAGCIAV